jgi:hypothetical protein
VVVIEMKSVTSYSRRTLAGLAFAALALAQGAALAQDPAPAAAEGEAAAAPASAEGDPPLGIKGMRKNNERGYGPAGCGLGSLLFEADSGFTQILAATTNGFFGNQTFAISTGTLNCADTSGGTASTKAFVATNRSALSRDIARGSGETLQGLSKLAGCAPDAAVGASLQRNFSSIFPHAAVSDADVGNAVVRALKSDAALQCRALT